MATTGISCVTGIMAGASLVGSIVLSPSASAETIAVDYDRDGYRETLIGGLSGPSGAETVMKFVWRDEDHNGGREVLYIDSDGDRRYDAFYANLDQQGPSDIGGLDTNRDGRYDVVLINQSPDGLIMAPFGVDTNYDGQLEQAPAGYMVVIPILAETADLSPKPAPAASAPSTGSPDINSPAGQNTMNQFLDIQKGISDSTSKILELPDYDKDGKLGASDYDNFDPAVQLSDDPDRLDVGAIDDPNRS